ncbi:MAG TPA: ribosome maturation factor RimM [Devosiaceae bacterium]|jgi:16S rRNA processing protein RimM
MDRGGAQHDNLLLLGRIGAAHGIKGEVRVTAFTGDPLAIAGYGPLSTSRPGLTVSIARARIAKNVVIAKLKGIDDRNAAERLNGVDLFIDRARLPAVEDDDDFYHIDLIGLEARLADGTVLGEVISVPNFGAGDLLEIRDTRTGTDLLYPFTKAVVPDVRIKDGYLTILPPDETEASEADAS